MQLDPMTAARHALAEMALAGLLRDAGMHDDPNDKPDGLVVRMTAEGTSVTFTRGKFTVGEVEL